MATCYPIYKDTTRFVNNHPLPLLLTTLLSLELLWLSKQKLLGDVFHAFWTDSNNVRIVVWLYEAGFVPTLIHQEHGVTASGSF